MSWPTLHERIVALETMSPAQLRSEWRAVHRKPPPQLTPDLLARGIAWQLQTRAFGGLSRKAESILNRYALGRTRSAPDKALKLGTRLVRRWQDRTYDVLVVESGFLHDGTIYTSLTAVAEAITGSRRSGPLFFGLREGKSSNG